MESTGGVLKKALTVFKRIDLLDREYSIGDAGRSNGAGPISS